MQYLEELELAHCEQVAEMATSRYKVYRTKSLNSKLSVLGSSLRKELVYVKRAVTELSCQLERVLSDETVHQVAKDAKTALPSEQGSENDGSNLVEEDEEGILSGYVSEVELKTVSSSAGCQCLEKAAGVEDLRPNAQGSSVSVEEHHNMLTDAMENRQWFKHDQQREAYLKGLLDRMLWMEKQLNEANQARSKQHKEDHSDEIKELAEMQDYERFLLKVKDDMEELRNEINLACKNLIEVRSSLEEGHCCFESESQQLKDLQYRLDVEKRRSANFELQAKRMSNQHYEDQENIAELKRQMKIYSQDLKDNKEDCGYLKKQMMRVLKALRNMQHATKESKRDQQDPLPREEAQPPSQLSRQSFTASSHSSFMDERSLECPGCLAEYPVSQYRELLNHVEICLD